MTRYSEVERKFDVDPGALLPDLSGAAVAVSEGVESQLDATYFDTADTRLARQRITLRRRTGGDDAGWHLKLPAGQDERTEVRLPLGRATRTVPRSRPSRTTRFTGRGWPTGPSRSPHGARSRSSSYTGTGHSSTRSAANCKPRDWSRRSRVRSLRASWETSPTRRWQPPTRGWSTPGGPRL